MVDWATSTEAKAPRLTPPGSDPNFVIDPRDGLPSTCEFLNACSSSCTWFLRRNQHCLLVFAQTRGTRLVIRAELAKRFGDNGTVGVPAAYGALNRQCWPQMEKANSLASRKDQMGSYLYETRRWSQPKCRSSHPAFHKMRP
jgi:hypothetical protein